MSFDENAKNWDTEKRINRAKIIGNESLMSCIHVIHFPIKENI